ncbi:MAG TPA: PleD family two-component system response regulator [Rhodospirillaceae bacterium]|jgi:two-component system cell cycle response regulator|nr:PleD family two-component system response regulator [Alphaproteobacteria bacterium]HBH26315.1 PleD family two-component system response regulator [Rhodospirillaceae bacterium]
MSARVLVVDDIWPNIKMLEAHLRTQYYDVLTAGSGAEALEKAKAESPDIVLLDIMMPGMDGFETCQRLKADPALSHIPVVMVTALTDPQDKVRGLEVGADDFLSKPIDKVALMARVRSLVRLKMSLDEWRVRENAASQLGVVAEAANVMSEPVEGARILIIEDKEFEMKKIGQTLRGDSAIVITASGGTDALELAGVHAFDLIIVSLNLSGEDGLRLCSLLRSSERTRSVPLVMVGSEADMPRIAQGLEIGAHDYILRPLDMSELRARVRTQIRRKRFQDRLRSTYEISLSLALTDALTGLYNRRYLEVHLGKLLEKNRAAKKSLAVLMMDIDHFKKVNDTQGHDVGDEVLKVFAQRLQENLRSFDLVARMGGEEFVAILPDVTEARAHAVAERLRRAVAEEPVPCSVPEGTLPITTSIGGAFIDGEGAEEADTLEAIKRADANLYKAKQAGRNCSVFEDYGKLDPADFPATGREGLA